MPLRAERRGELVHVDAVDGEGDDPARLDAAVVQRQAGHRSPSCSRSDAPRPSTRSAMASTPSVERVVAPPRRGRAGWRPTAPSSRSVGRRRGRSPRRPAPTRAACTSRNGGSSRSIHSRRDVEEAGAAWRPQVLAAGGGEEVAPQRADVDRELPDGLTRVEQVGDAGGAGHRAHRGGGVHQPALRGDPRHRHQPDTRRRASPRSASTDSWPDSSSGTTSTVAPVRARELQQPDHVARVLGAAT